MGAVRPEFRVDVFVPQAGDPIFGGPACVVSGCERICQHRASGLCRAHSQRWKRLFRHLDLATFIATASPDIVGSTPPAPCTVQGCGRAHASRGLCALHWSAWRRAGGPSLPVGRRPRPRSGRSSRRHASCRGVTCGRRARCGSAGFTGSAGAPSSAERANKILRRSSTTSGPTGWSGSTCACSPPAQARVPVCVAVPRRRAAQRAAGQGHHVRASTRGSQRNDIAARPVPGDLGSGPSRIRPQGATASAPNTAPVPPPRVAIPGRSGHRAGLGGRISLRHLALAPAGLRRASAAAV